MVQGRPKPMVRIQDNLISRPWTSLHLQRPFLQIWSCSQIWSWGGDTIQPTVSSCSLPKSTPNPLRPLPPHWPRTSLQHTAHDDPLFLKSLPGLPSTLRIKCTLLPSHHLSEKCTEVVELEHLSVDGGMGGVRRVKTLYPLLSLCLSSKGFIRKGGKQTNQSPHPVKAQWLVPWVWGDEPGSHLGGAGWHQAQPRGQALEAGNGAQCPLPVRLQQKAWGRWRVLTGQRARLEAAGRAWAFTTSQSCWNKEGRAPSLL